MKATGIVRRFDDLGRIVIPKEIRQRFNLKEGAPMEIWLHEDGRSIVLTPYSFELNAANLIRQAVEVLEGDDEKEPYREILKMLANKLEDKGNERTD